VKFHSHARRSGGSVFDADNGSAAVNAFRGESGVAVELNFDLHFLAGRQRGATGQFDESASAAEIPRFALAEYIGMLAGNYTGPLNFDPL
jgi:hypothetical protein